MNKDYTKLEKHKGIYKNKTTGRYLAVKKVKGVQSSESFDRVRDAIHWRSTFNGVKQNQTRDEKRSPTLLEVWESMKELHFPTVEYNTIVYWKSLFKVLKKLHHIHMEDFTPSVIDNWLKVAKEDFKSNPKRHGFKKELQVLKMLFNWYKNDPENGDYRFVSPVLRRHQKMSVLKVPEVKDKKIGPEDAFKFIRLLPQPYQDLAMFQFLTASRIGETAGVQIKNINLKKRELVIKDCCVWGRGIGEKFVELKPYPKNRQVRYCYINDLLLKVIKKRLKCRVTGSDYLFHIEGQPLIYNKILAKYTKAQKTAKIEQTGTHILRYGMATLTRKITRSLDATMAMTGHKDAKMADHYSEIGKEVQKETSLKVEGHLKAILG